MKRGAVVVVKVTMAMAQNSKSSITLTSKVGRTKFQINSIRQVCYDNNFTLQFKLKNLNKLVIGDLMILHVTSHVTILIKSFRI